MTLDPAELTRHAAFLGAPGSGKTTIALNLVEQLLLRGVPAHPGRPQGGPLRLRPAGVLAAARCPIPTWRRGARRLRAGLDVAVYTPGNPQGRPLSITVAPAGLGQLGSLERGQVARYAATALAGMMNYGTNRSDQSRQAILASAIELLA